MMRRLGVSTLLRYAALAVPLAFAGLPIYVTVPKFYAERQGMNLALLGALLLGVRLIDCFLDPLIGWWPFWLLLWPASSMVLLQLCRRRRSAAR